MTPRVVLATFGSLGDLHPFIALALALQSRGLTPVIACAADYQSKVEAAGVAFAPLRPGLSQLEDDLGVSRAALMRRIIRDDTFLFRRLLLPYVRASYEDMLRLTAGADLVLSSSLAIGARLAAEKHAVPCMTIVLQPMMFLSAYDPPALPGMPWLRALLRRLGPVATGQLLRLLRVVLGRLFAPVARLRAEIGLPLGATDVLFAGQFSSAGAIGLYSDLLGGVQPDYPQPTAIVGFAPYDSEDGGADDLDPALEKFLAAGAPPLVFTLGSSVVHSPGDFFRHSTAAAARLGLRAVLVGGTSLPDCAALRSSDVFVSPYAPYSRLFGRAAAIVHQGGIGTLGQALRSGKPQLIVPFFADQPDNAARAAALGVARVLSPGRYGRRVTRELGVLLRTPNYGLRAAQLRQQLGAEDGAAAAADLICRRLVVHSAWSTDGPVAAVKRPTFASAPGFD